jgi:hypothetical protein
MTTPNQEIMDRNQLLNTFQQYITKKTKQYEFQSQAMATSDDEDDDSDYFNGEKDRLDEFRGCLGQDTSISCYQVTPRDLEIKIQKLLQHFGKQTPAQLIEKPESWNELFQYVADHPYSRNPELSDIYAARFLSKLISQIPEQTHPMQFLDARKMNEIYFKKDKVFPEN